MPNSILWIGLVVLWVFVLFPILADRHPRIRQTTDVALATRVLHRGGSKRRMRKGPAAGHDSDPDYRPTRAQRKLLHSDDAEDRMSTPADEQVTEADQQLGPLPELETGGSLSDTVEADGDIAAAELAESPEHDPADTSFDADAANIAADHNDSDHADAATDGFAANSDNPADDDDVADEYLESTAARIPPARSAAPARVDDPHTSEPEYSDEQDYEDAEFTGAPEYGGDSDFVPTRRGRGGYDPEADAIARAARYTFRQRAVLGLVLTAILCGALGLVLSPLLWWACGLSVAILATYLAYLRKQVRMEEDIRRRRSARLSRGRDIEDHAVERSRRAQQQARRDMDRETARSLRRRSTLLEPDDEDPAFHHLDPFDPATARALRRATESELRRAAGA
ncbi:divisome protein SepX/GlpR [Nocardia arizonensis]|uniref:divisome protein SepX/GlpR n=1 Tax=Nocardia arizonensis TaxID=1141647 RepID=UPI0006D0A522|nr:gephyrin-like molybdotransferase receptor GlpR [Nocardia arizonensis]